MKKLFFLLFIPSLSFGAVTEAQVDQANACAQAIFACSTDLLRYTQNVKALFRSGFTVPVAGSTTTVTIPQTLQDEIINVQGYQTKKGNCVTAFNSCP